MANNYGFGMTGASSVPLENYKGWETQKLDQIPGLKKVPFSKMPSALVPEIAGIARIDALWGTEEAKRYRTITGSYQQGFQVPCNENCAYLELDDIEGTGRTIRSEFEGKQWISGKYQKVNGGSGCLKMVNGGKEPTGRHPFGKAFKVSLEDTSQSDDTAQTALYFRIKVKCGATPYFLGPFPFLKVQRDGWIIY
ncbi:hypothetical protein C7H19_23425 [Aphanothece hegewaldii CCALA 016]|uniref:Uncharacterized protein n=1 Tax=Aphanothece hegewaldii CCALA 016 TaxID=2107694 RepID=A0A2T1LRA4_9CHRO|nr:hypothetical protein [Aphanothece hegewaldii]PSF31079.1 hypothetical protein C7H19_23425 [Aphanothece hegewaldii CCALA 016]